jgi:hypothetical protein
VLRIPFVFSNGRTETVHPLRFLGCRRPQLSSAWRGRGRADHLDLTIAAGRDLVAHRAGQNNASVGSGAGILDRVAVDQESFAAKRVGAGLRRESLNGVAREEYYRGRPAGGHSSQSPFLSLYQVPRGNAFMHLATALRMMELNEGR